MNAPHELRGDRVVPHRPDDDAGQRRWRPVDAELLQGAGDGELREKSNRADDVEEQQAGDDLRAAHARGAESNRVAHRWRSVKAAPSVVVHTV